MTPAISVDGYSSAGSPVYFRVCPRFGLPVIPPKPGEDADAFGDLLFDVQPETVFDNSGLPRCTDVLIGLAVGAHVGLIHEAHDSHSAAFDVVVLPFKRVSTIC